MQSSKQQVISDILEALNYSRKEKAEPEGTKLYGACIQDNKVTDDALQNDDFTVYNLSNETGNGRITVYRVFTGIELYYNDMHMAYCNQNQETSKNLIEINHCHIGRYECSFGENGCCYIAEGDLAIGSGMKKKSYSSFPLNHYHGITIVMDMDKLLPQVRRIMSMLNIDIDYIKQYVCDANRLYIIRANPAIEHIFSELYEVSQERKAWYIKIKMLELLFFLSGFDAKKESLHQEYYNSHQVKLVKEVAAFITEDLTRHYTIEELAVKFGISATTLKKYFRGIYGTTVYAWLRTYRMQTAQKLLMETDKSVEEIAHIAGYENPNKFSSAFKSIYAMTPTEFKKCVRLDR